MEVPSFEAGYAEEVDLSTGDHTATIIGLLGCRLLDRDAISLVVDAGPINIAVTCYQKGSITHSYGIFRSSFVFGAESGHTYYLTTVLHEECIGLFDTTPANRPISCEPYEMGGPYELGN